MAKRVMMGIQALRTGLKERVDALDDGIQTVFTRHGRPVAVLIDVDWHTRACIALGEEPLGFETAPPPAKRAKDA